MSIQADIVIISFIDILIMNGDNMILERLFVSKVRIKILSVFMLNPEKLFSAWDLAKSCDFPYSAVWKELGNLEQAGVIQLAEISGRQKRFVVNTISPIYYELKSIFVKTVGLADLLKPILEKQNEIITAFIYGSLANGNYDSQSDVDLMIIGITSMEAILPDIHEVEKIIQRPINISIFTPSEWQDARNNRQAFVVNVIKSPIILLKGKLDDI